MKLSGLSAFAVTRRSKARVLVEMLAEKNDFPLRTAKDDNLKALLAHQAEADRLRVSEGFASDSVNRAIAEAGPMADQAKLLESTPGDAQCCRQRGCGAKRDPRTIS